MKKISTFILLTLLPMVVVNAQQRRCGTDEYMAKQIAADPQVKTRLDAIGAYARQYAATQTNKTASVVVTIPVVFHVVYANSTENISDQRLFDQITALNRDYRKLNSDTTAIPAAFKPLAADIEIEFCLAVRDPQGRPTTGITRTPTTVGFFIDDDKVKSIKTGGADGWDRNKYLNLWICDLGTDLLGYAQFPNTGAASTDGVVLHYKYTGLAGSSSPFNKGRTGTHEVGHWLGLYHTFQGGCSGMSATTCATQGDEICDTPPTANQFGNFGCPNTQNTCAETPVNQNDMTMNYMDYTDDACLFMFTTDQKTRMQAVINGFRASLMTSDGCVPVVLPDADAGIASVKVPENGMCTDTIRPVVVLKNHGADTLTTAEINYKIGVNGSLATQNWTGSLLSDASENVTLPLLTFANGDTLIVYTTNPNGVQDTVNTNDTSQVIINILTTSGVAPISNDFASATLLTGWSVKDMDTDGRTWSRTATVGISGNNSMRFNNFQGPNYKGREDHLLTPVVTLPTTQTTSYLSFYVAHAQFSSTLIDSLLVSISTDCGSTWTTMYRKGGTTLRTTTNMQTTQFAANSTQWRNDMIDISSYIGKDVRFRFTNKSGYGNNIYLDNINIGIPTGLKEEKINEPATTIYPNPANNSIDILTNSAKYLTVYNILGEQVLAQQLKQGENKVNLSEITEGNYIFVLTDEKTVQTNKVTIIK